MCINKCFFKETTWWRDINPSKNMSILSYVRFVGIDSFEESFRDEPIRSLLSLWLRVSVNSSVVEWAVWGAHRAGGTGWSVRIFAAGLARFVLAWWIDSLFRRSWYTEDEHWRCVYGPGLSGVRVWRSCLCLCPASALPPPPHQVFHFLFTTHAHGSGTELLTRLNNEAWKHPFVCWAPDFKWGGVCLHICEQRI